MKLQHVLGLSLALTLGLACTANAQELRPALPEVESSAQEAEEQQAIDRVTDKVLDPSAPAKSYSAATVSATPSAAVPEEKPDHAALGNVGKGAIKGVGSVGHGAKAGVEAVGHGAVAGAEKVGHGAKVGAEAVGHGAVAGVEKVGHGAKVGAEAVGHGAVTGAEKVGHGAKVGAEAVGHGAVAGAEKVGHGAKVGAEAVGHGAVKGAAAIGHGAENIGRGALHGLGALGHKGANLFDRNKPAASSAAPGKAVADNANGSNLDITPAPSPVSSPSDNPQGWTNK